MMYVKKPCSADWARMPGGSRERFCGACKKKVMNVAALRPDEAELLGLRSAAGEEICVRLTRNAIGELTTLPPSKPLVAKATQGLMFSACLTALPALAQGGEGPRALNEQIAVVTGRIRHPDGTAVNGGLVHLARQDGVGPVYVLDELGQFEIRTAPGMYTFVLQTGPEQARRVASVTLHPGEQSFGDVSTLDRSLDVMTDLQETTSMGELVSVVQWSWKAKLRHPILYARALARRAS